MTRGAKTATDKTTLLSKNNKTNTTTDNLNIMRYLNLRSTDLVTYEDNEEDAGSEGNDD